MAYHPAPGIVDDEGEAFARAVFGRFLRQATICRDIDDAIEHMHIVNDNSNTFEIRLGGEARVPVSRELILALASKKKELLYQCESALRASRVSVAVTGTAGAGSPLSPPQAVVFPPPTALAATGEGVTAASPLARQAETATPSPAGAAAGVEERAPAATIKPEPVPIPQPVAYVPTNNPPPAPSTRPRNGMRPTTVFVRKVDVKVDRDELIEHFASFGEVTGVSMNPTRGYAFVDFASHDCVVRAVRATQHVVGHKMLEVEMKKELPNSRTPRPVRR